MSNEKLQPYETKMQKSLDALEREYTTIRAGRANPHILDKLKVDYYGTPTPLQQVGNVTVPEARVLMIQPWESKLIKDIEKAILASDIGITPTNDGKSIRLVFPELTEERRKELAKDVKKKGGGVDYKGLTKAEMQISINSFRLQFMSSEDCAARHKGRWENLLVRCFPGKELSRNIRSFKGD